MAEFVGEANVVPVSVVEVVDDSVVVRLAGDRSHPLRVRRRARAGDGTDPPVVVLRPQHLRLVTPGEGHLIGSIQRVSFLGPHSRYRIEVPGGSVIHVEAVHRSGWAVGDLVGIHVEDRSGSALTG